MSTRQERFPAFEVSHIGLFVHDLDMMVEFYTRLFGLLITDRGVVRGTSRIAFLSRDPREHHQIVLVEGRNAGPDARVVNQISLRVADLEALRAVLRIIERDSQVSDIKPSNHGNAFSIYFRDPENNRLELFTDSPFYVEQAVTDPLDLAEPDDRLIMLTGERYRARASFQPVEEWRAQFTARLAAVEPSEERTS